jgi:hypothetical protein
MELIQESLPGAEKFERIIEARESFLDRLTATADKKIRAATKSLSTKGLLRRLESALGEFGVVPENISIVVSEGTGIGGKISLTLSENGNAESLKSKERERGESPSYRIALLGVMLGGCGVNGPEKTPEL